MVTEPGGCTPGQWRSEEENAEGGNLHLRLVGMYGVRLYSVATFVFSYAVDVY